MDKSNHPCSTESQRSDFHQGTRHPRQLSILRHWAQEQEQGLVQVLETALALALDVGELALEAVLVVAPRRRCSRSSWELGSRRSQGAPMGMWSHQGNKSFLHSRCRLRIHQPHCLQPHSSSQTPSG